MKQDDPSPRHAFSIDVEDWYQGVTIPMRRWDRYESRVHLSMGELLDLLAAGGVRATCFVLGKVAEEHPQLVRDIHEEGHEVATHGYSHTEVYDLSPGAFREEIKRSVGLLQDLTGQKVLGYRAPYFTITKRSLWALEILRDEGLAYDSSIHPVYHDRYGIPEADRRPSRLPLDGGGDILETPVSTLPVAGVNLPVGGGAYLRFYPYVFWRACLRHLERRGETINLYMHPWEIDPGQPRIDLPLRAAIPHYFRLASTKSTLKKLFRDFDFAPYREVYRSLIRAS